MKSLFEKLQRVTIFFSLLLFLIVSGCASEANIRVGLNDKTVPTNSEWDELPEHVQERYVNLANAADPKQKFDRPPYPKGGMAGIMKRVTYPKKAMKAEIEGRVLVEAVVTEDGRVRDAKVIKSVHRSLDTEALNTVQGAKFEPALANGNPVTALICVPIRFALR